MITQPGQGTVTETLVMGIWQIRDAKGNLIGSVGHADDARLIAWLHGFKLVSLTDDWRASFDRWLEWRITR